MTPREAIIQLAPTALDNDRSSRYHADDQAVTLADLSAVDAEVIVWLYGYLRELDAIVGGPAPVDDPTPLLAFMARNDVDAAVRQVRRIGAKVTDARIAEVCHDLRGGAMGVLFVQLSRFVRAPYRAELARSLFIVTRDHLKIMRNVVRDLDAEARERDLAFREHHLGDLARALGEFTASHGETQVKVEVDCPRDAIIAESCVECGAIDRVAYNLLNNAVRHASDPLVSVWLVRLDKDLRVAVANAMAPEHRPVIEQRLTTDPASLFGGFTTTGSGCGLRIVSELVGSAYGIASVKRLVEGGHIGTTLLDGRFVAWFHWPLSDAR